MCFQSDNTTSKTATAACAVQMGVVWLCVCAVLVANFHAAWGQQNSPGGYVHPLTEGPPSTALAEPLDGDPSALRAESGQPGQAFDSVVTDLGTADLAQRVSDLEAALERLDEKPPSPPKKPASGFSLHFHGHLLMDAVAFSQDAADKQRVNEQNAVGIPVARIIAEGDGVGTMSYKIEFDYVWNLVGDLYLTIGKLPHLHNLRIGYMKEPFSLEQLESPKYTVFMERSLARDVHPIIRRMGAMAFDMAPNERATWAIGLFSDAPGFRVVRADAFGGALTMRTTYLPWYDAESSGRYMLHTAIAYSHRQAAQHTIRFRTLPGAHFASFIVDSGEIPAHTADLLNTELALVHGPLSIQSEYTLGWIDAITQPNSQVRGSYVLVSYFLTGENRHYVNSKGIFSRITPFRNFIRTRDDRGCLQTGPGAWELKYRYSYVDAFDSGRLGAQQAGVHAVGVNWYLNPSSRVMAEYLVAASSPNNGQPDGVLNIFQMRAQFEF